MNADQDAKNSWPAWEASKAACAALVVPNFTYLQRKHQSVNANAIQAPVKTGKHNLSLNPSHVYGAVIILSWNVARSLIAAMLQRRYPTCSDLALFASSAWMLDVKTARAKSIPFKSKKKHLTKPHTHLVQNHIEFNRSIWVHFYQEVNGEIIISVWHLK